VLAFTLRRVLTALPSLLLFAIALFIAVSIAPPAETPTGEDLARRFWHLPLIVNLDPDDRPRVVERIMGRIGKEEGEPRKQDLDRLFRVGAAGLGEIVPALNRLGNVEGARLARELAPLAFRMGIEDVTVLEDPARATAFWSHVLDERSADLRPTSVRRALRRHLSDRGEPLYARQLRNADTAILAPIFEEIPTADAEARETLESLAISALHRAGATSVNSPSALRAYWAVHRAEYVEYGAVERVAARITETRFGRWVVQAVTERFGASWRTGAPVLDDLKRRAPLTFARSLLGLMLAYVVAVPLGILAAARRTKPLDRTVSLLVLLVHALPAFVLALIAQAASPRLAQSDGFVAVAIALVALGPIARHMRSRLLEEAQQDYVRAARAMGQPGWAIWIDAIFRNAFGSLVAFAAIQVPLILSATILAEEILALDGLGPAAIAAVRARDVPWMMAFGMLMAIAAAAALLVADIAQALNDARVRRTMLVERTEDA
jgi:peptide/nickel transport system permease protein